MLLTKLLPLFAMGGIGYHSSEAVKSRIDKIMGAKGGFVTRQRMNTIMYTITLDMASGESMTIRSDEDLKKYIRKRIRIKNRVDDPTKDQWGSYFRCELDGNTFTIMSSGKDKTFNTRDDVKISRNIYDY